MKTAITLFFLFFANVLLGQTQLTLKQAIRTGVTNSIEMRNANLEQQIAEFRIKNNYRNRLPEVNLNVSESNKINKVNSPVSFIEGFYTEAGLNMAINGQWEIYDGKKNQYQKKVLKKQKEITDVNILLKRENVVEAIQLAYFDALVKQEIFDLLKEQTTLSETKWLQAKYERDLGQKSDYEVLRYRNAFLTDSSFQIVQQNELQLALKRLSLSMGETKAKSYQLVDELSVQEISKKNNLRGQRLQFENKALREQLIQVELMKENTNALKSLFQPIIAVNAGLYQNFNAVKFSEVPSIKGRDANFFANFSLAYPLYDGGKRNMNMEESRMKEKLEQWKTVALEREIKNQIAQLRDQYDLQMKVINIQEELIKNLEFNLLMVDDQVKNGMASILEYRTIQQELLSAKKTKIESIGVLKKIEIQLKKITGQLK